jgi:hypothetical protein
MADSEGWGIGESLDALVAAFNRGSLDVPARLFTPRTTFALNGRSYESILGGSPDDPLIRLLARGAAGYRTAAKALQYALQRPSVVLESLSEPDSSGLQTASLRVEGRLRDSQQPLVAGATLRLRCRHGELTSIDVLCADDDLARIAGSRRA